MIVLEALEQACCHHILEISRRLVLCDLARMLQHQAKMAATPGNRFTIADQSCGYASHRLLSRSRSAGHVQIDTQREKKTSPRRSGDPRLKLDCLHATARGSSAQPSRSRVG